MDQTEYLSKNLEILHLLLLQRDQLYFQKNDYDLVDETVLEKGDFTQVKPGEYHQFEALEDTIAFELYWAEFDHNDIIRESVGTMKIFNGDPERDPTNKQYLVR